MSDGGAADYSAANREEMPAGGPPRHRGHAHAGVDDLEPDPDAGRSDRRGERRIRAGGRGDAERRIDGGKIPGPMRADAGYYHAAHRAERRDGPREGRAHGR